MRLIAFLFLFLCLASVAQAAPKHGVYSSGVSCPYPGDNGCAVSTTYVAAPAFQDTAFAYNHATSGQLPTDCVSPTTCTVNTNAITNLTALWHTDNVNLPYWDYPIGSANPATLTPISSFPSDGTCSYNATGSGYGGPALVCQQVATSPAVETIQGYDFTNLGAGTGTSCAQLYILNSNTPNNNTGGGIAYQFINNYHKAIGPCFVGNYNTSGLIFQKSGGLYTPTNLTFYNITCDGNYNNAPDTSPDSFTGYIDNGSGSAGTKLTVVSGTAVYGDVLTGGTVAIGTSVQGGTLPNMTVYPSQLVGSAGSPVTFTGHKQAIYGQINCVRDNRQGSQPKTFKYVLMKNFGHDPWISTAGGDETVYYSAFVDFCQSGGLLCHGEIFEDTLGNTTRNYDITGNLVELPSTYNVNLQSTTAFYMTSGANNNSIVNNAYIRDNLIVFNKMNCSNAGPYTPANPCGSIGTGGTVQQGGYGIFSTSAASYVNAFTLTGNVIDGTGAFYCYTRSLAINGSGMTGAVLGVLSAGQNLTFTTPTNNYTVPPSVFGIFPGLQIHDGNATDIANGWLDATITTFTGATAPIFSNTGTLCTAGAGAPGQAGGAGCGSMLLSQVEPVTVAALTDWSLATGVLTLNAWSNNWSVGGAYGATARSIANPSGTFWLRATCP